MASQHLGWEGKGAPKEMVSPRPRKVTGLEKGCSPTSQVGKRLGRGRDLPQTQQTSRRAQQ